MKVLSIELDPNGVRELFRSEWCKDECYAKAVAHIPTSAAGINANAHSPISDPVKAMSKRLDNTCIGLVVPKTRAAAAIAYKYGMK